MDSPDKMESEPSFPKISSDAAHRTYRRPRSNSASSDESPKHERNKNHDSSKSEREIERVKSHNRSERENERHHSDRHSRGRHDDYKSHNHGKRYDNYDYKSRNKDERRRKDDDGDRERKDRYDRDRERKDDRVRERKDDRDRERKDYYEKRNERENEKRKHTESVEVKQRESKFSKPENKDVEEKPGSSSNQAGTDLNAAKAAAMKAADSLNKNIGGVVGGALTTEQKKRLLWGNKKTQPTQDITKNWDLNLFADRERQEKFNKLMGLKGNQDQETKSEVPDVKKREEKLEIDLEKQYTAGLRRRDGRTVGLGL